MCCDGTMFEFVSIEPHEVAPLRADFAIASDRDGEPSFTQPCPHSVDRSCAIYARRPGICRSYRCATLSGLSEGAITSAEARRRIGEVFKARQSLTRWLAPGESLPAARQRRKRLASAPAAPGNTPFILALTVLDLLIDRYFHREGQSMFTRKRAADGSSAS